MSLSADSVVRIEPASARLWVNWTELWRYRELLYFLAWRDVKVRYRQTVLGASWAVLQPLATVGILTAVFGRVAGVGNQTGGVPYPLFLLAALLPWLFFAAAVTAGSQSLVVSAPILTKVYFPRYLVPLSSVAVTALDFVVSLALLAGLLVYYGQALHLVVALAPVFLCAIVLAGIGLGSLLAVLVALYRDFRHVVPVVLQLWFFATPVIYPRGSVGGRLRALLVLNPLTGVIDGFRASVLGLPLEWTAAGISLCACSALFAIGTACFRLLEPRIADSI